MATIGPTTDHDEIRGWAEQHKIGPVEMFSHIVDHEPSSLRLMFKRSAEGRKDLLPISWEEFFSGSMRLGLRLCTTVGLPARTRFCRLRASLLIGTKRMVRRRWSIDAGHLRAGKPRTSLLVFAYEFHDVLTQSQRTRQAGVVHVSASVLVHLDAAGIAHDGDFVDREERAHERA